MAVDTTTAPEQVQRILVQPLEAASTFLAAGPRTFDSAGPLAGDEPLGAGPYRYRRIRPGQRFGVIPEP